MRDGLPTALESLLEVGHWAESALSARTLQALAPLLDSGSLVRRRRGRGNIVAVAHAGAVRAFYEARFPPVSPTDVDLPRAAAVALTRNTKRAPRTTGEPALLRALAPLVAERGGWRVDLLSLTNTAGAACLVVDDAAPWTVTAPETAKAVVATVENLECFLHVEGLNDRVDGALYAGGRLSERVLGWLASEAMSGCAFLHCGDYDPTGLDEYLRLRARLGDRVRLHVPRDLDRLLDAYGNPELLHRSEALLGRLRHEPDSDVRRVVTAMDRAGCGLEQEALLLREEE